MIYNAKIGVMKVCIGMGVYLVQFSLQGFQHLIYN